MKKLLISIIALSSVFGLASGVMAEDCTPAPDCASLGYTQTAADCSGAALKCPWDLTKVACRLAVPCEVGSILGGDQLCYADRLPDNVRPIGIVFDDDNCLAVALTDIKKDGTVGSTRMQWSSSYCDTPNLDNCSDSDCLTSCGVDGRTNTDAILASTCNGTTYAANGANAYEPSGCSKDFCKAGQWFLPSIRELMTLYNAKSEVNASLNLTASSGATALTESSYWSSTEYFGSDKFAWTLNIYLVGKADTALKDYNDNGYSSGYVRPVVKY